MVQKKSHRLEIQIFPIAALSSAISSTLNAPLKLIKIRLQCNQALYQSSVIHQPYKGFIDLLSKVQKNEGLLGFWKGNLANIISLWLAYLPQMAVKHIDLEIGSSSFLMLFSTLAITYPLDYARVRLANNINNKEKKFNFTGISDTLRKTIQSQGLRGIYRGFSVGIISILTYRFIYFTISDALMKIDKQKMSISAKALQTLFLATFFSYPLDTLKKRMMMSSLSENPYGSSIVLWKDILTKESVKSLYGGYMVHLISSGFGIVGLSMYDSLMKSTKKRSQ